MNKEEILAMEAGTTLNALVAEKVMAIELGIHAGYKGVEVIWSDGRKTIVPSQYSTDISAAWEVVNSVKTKGYRVNLNIASKNSGGVINGIAEEGDWHCNVLGDGGDANHVYAKTAPEAISKAALLAVME